MTPPWNAFGQQGLTPTNDDIGWGSRYSGGRIPRRKRVGADAVRVPYVSAIKFESNA